MTDLSHRLVRAAVVGCGRMGAFTSEAVKLYAPSCWFPLSHIEAMQAHPDVDLAGACDSHEGNLARAAELYAIPNRFADPAEMIEQLRPRLLGVATRTPGRADIIAHALAHDVRAFHVEKPLCNSMAELESLSPLQDSDAHFMTYGTIRRLFGIYEIARDMANSGEFGELQEVRVQMGHGQLFWTHPHSVDLILFAAAGRSVRTIQSRLSGLVRTEDATIESDPHVEWAAIEFDDGVVGQIGRGAGADLILTCSGGEIRVVNDGFSIELRKTDGANPYPFRSDLDGLVGESGPQGVFRAIANLMECLAGNIEARQANRAVKQDIFTGQRMLFAMVQSQLVGSKPIALEEIDPGLCILAKSGRVFA